MCANIRNFDLNYEYSSDLDLVLFLYCKHGIKRPKHVKPLQVFCMNSKMAACSLEASVEKGNFYARYF